MRRHAARLLIVLLSFLIIATASAAPDDDLAPAQRARYHALIGEFRCVVCQNRSIDSSDAPLAGDLRALVARQIAAGRSNAQIKSYLVERYGDWVLYDPPFQWSTLLLWFGPFVLLLLGLWLIVVIVRGQRRVAEQSRPSANDRQRLDALLGRRRSEDERSRPSS